MKNKIKVIRPQNLANNIAIVDGFSGAGKSLLLPVLSHLDNGEVWQVSEETEGVCLLSYLNKIDYDAAKALVRKNFDKRIYELSISRNVNFRASDDSSIQGTLLTSKYEKRMKDAAEREQIVEKIQKNRPLLVMDAHYLFGFSDLYINSFGNSLSLYVFMLRNPAHLVSAYFLQDLEKRIGNDPMDVELCVEINGKIVPYYVVDCFDEYCQCNNDLEKVILIIYSYLQKVYSMYKGLDAKQREKFYFISFENFSTNPEFFMDDICETIGIKRADSYEKMLKCLELPRTEEEIDYKKTYELAKQKNITIRKKYKNMLDELIKNHKDFLASELKFMGKK